jgi:hypothetical protein
VRSALSPDTLKRVYGRIAARYDLQHALLTARSDQRGRELLVAQAVRSGDRVLDCGAGAVGAGEGGGAGGLLAADRCSLVALSGLRRREAGLIRLGP